MSIHEHLPPQIRRELKEVGWTKAAELAKVARRDGKDFDCAAWMHKARSLPRDQFKREVEKELRGRRAKPTELIYFKVYKSQIPVIEQAIETAALMLGTDKSRGYCLEMICADFLAGAHLDGGQPGRSLVTRSHAITSSCPANSSRLSSRRSRRRRHEPDSGKEFSPAPRSQIVRRSAPADLAPGRMEVSELRRDVES